MCQFLSHLVKSKSSGPKKELNSTHITGNLVGLLRFVITAKPCYIFSGNGSVNTNPNALLQEDEEIVKRMNIVCI